MKKIRIKNFSTGFVFLCLSVLVFFFIYLVAYFPRPMDAEKASGKIQAEISIAEDVLTSYLELLSCNVDRHAKTVKIKYLPEFNRTAVKKSISGWIYIDDSLQFWTGNDVPLPVGFEKTIRNSETFSEKMKNGWYLFRVKKEGSLVFLVAMKIKSDYPFQNKYLKNEFTSCFSDIPDYFQPLIEKGRYSIFSRQGTFLFSLSEKRNQVAEIRDTVFLFILFLIGFVSFLFFINRLYSIPEIRVNFKNSWKVFLAVDLILVRAIQFYIGFPEPVYKSTAFSPTWYASSLIPSMGDFAINQIVITLLVYLLFTSRKQIGSWLSMNKGRKILTWMGTVLVLTLAYKGTIFLVNDLIINSSGEIDLQNIFEISTPEILELLIMGSIVFSFWLFSFSIVEILGVVAPEKWQKAILLFLISGAIFSITTIGAKPELTGYYIPLIIYSLFICFLLIKIPNQITASTVLLFISTAAVFATVLLDKGNHQKENEKRKLIALTLSEPKNPLTENLFEKVNEKIKQDTLIQNLIHHNQELTENTKRATENYIKEKYFQNYWQRYNYQLTVCYPGKKLKIQPQGYLVDCNGYFQTLIKEYGESTSCMNLFMLDYGIGNENYLIILHAGVNGNYNFSGNCMFIELSLKNAGREQGYPDLLINNSQVSEPMSSDYSHAFYRNKKLVYSVGLFNYRLDMDRYLPEGKSPQFIQDKDVSHYVYRVNTSNVLVVSKPETGMFSRISSIPYFFLVFVILSIGVVVFYKEKKPINFSVTRLQNRLQLVMLGVLLLTFLIAGIVILFRITEINHKKQQDFLKEKMQSLVVEFQHKYGETSEIRDVSSDEINDLIVKLSNVFYTEINFYTPWGEILATSRPQIFEEGIQSPLINPEAKDKLDIEKQSFLIQTESIGTLKFNSAYAPVFNSQNKILGYLNLPDFSRQDELKKEISGTLATFFNIFIMLVMFGVFITILLSKYISAPLKLLSEKMAQFKLGEINDKIEWKNEDEIGQLVHEFNQMIDKLEKSAERLAVSERESAWREMAKQVAHEIKNPLTPIKLNIQYLQKAWKENAPDWEIRLERFARSITEQIETLSEIASAFSDFAGMPDDKTERIDLVEVARNVIDLYKDISPITITLAVQSEKSFIVADRRQMIRVFTNLINNSIQAIPIPAKGIINLNIHRENDYIIIQVKDNGTGISEEETGRIFKPNFTTKSGGSGLGLAMVKTIIRSMKGEITFSSAEHIGTTFIIKILAWNEE